MRVFVGVLRAKMHGSLCAFLTVGGGCAGAYCVCVCVLDGLQQPPHSAGTASAVLPTIRPVGAAMQVFLLYWK